MRLSMKILVPCAWLLALAHGPASAFTFVLAGGSTDQHMNWYWEAGATSCTNSAGGPCGDVYSANGEIPWNGRRNVGIVTGGSLDWTASSGSLMVVALCTNAARNSGSFSVIETWTAIDAALPVTFMVIPEAGEPTPLNLSLLIRPRLVGTFELLSHLGSQAYMNVQLTYAVSVNGALVSRDSLFGEFTESDGGTANWIAAFPKGAANTIVVPNVTNGSLVDVAMWAYLRPIAFGVATADVYGTYGDGVAIEIQLSNANAVAVGDQPEPPLLSLAAGPNPSSGNTRIAYTLPRAGDVMLAIYDVGGHRVATLADGFQEPGRREMTWTGKGAGGRSLSAGVYLMELIAGGERRVGKLVLTR